MGMMSGTRSRSIGESFFLGWVVVVADLAPGDLAQSGDFTAFLRRG